MFGSKLLFVESDLPQMCQRHVPRDSRGTRPARQPNMEDVVSERLAPELRPHVVMAIKYIRV